MGSKPGLESGPRGQTKVSELAKGLAIKFSGDPAPPPAKKEAVESKVVEVEKVGSVARYGYFLLSTVFDISTFTDKFYCLLNDPVHTEAHIHCKLNLMLQQPVNRQQYAAPKSLIVGSTTGSSDVCYFCEQRVYLVERHSAEGVFFHRGCLRCEYCGTNLRIGQYCFRREDDGKGLYIFSNFSFN